MNNDVENISLFEAVVGSILCIVFLLCSIWFYYNLLTGNFF